MHTLRLADAENHVHPLRLQMRRLPPSTDGTRPGRLHRGGLWVGDDVPEEAVWRNGLRHGDGAAESVGCVVSGRSRPRVPHSWHHGMFSGGDAFRGPGATTSDILFSRPRRVSSSKTGDRREQDWRPARTSRTFFLCTPPALENLSSKNNDRRARPGNPRLTPPGSISSSGRGARRARPGNPLLTPAGRPWGIHFGPGANRSLLLRFLTPLERMLE